MNGPNAPLSPVSVNGNEWSGYSRMDKDGPFPNSRGQLISPPNSGGSIGAMNGGYSTGPRSAGGPSPPPSIGRSSAGTNIYARSESGRNSQREDGGEMLLGEHYVVLKRFLSSTSQNGQPAPPPNKARDKLQRLTPVQFLELSTDVYDELNRRFPPAGTEQPPEYLLPKEGFHIKRNQARQKLSSLPPARFRDLATDVFCELERRFPRFVAGDIPRMNSPASVRIPSRTQTPVNGMNGFPPRAQSRGRRPSEASSIRSAAMGLSAYGVPQSPGLPPNNYERPLAKQSQSNTIVPIKSTMVEEDDDSPVSPTSIQNRNALGLNMANEQTNATSETDKTLMEDYKVQVRDLQMKLSTTEEDLRKKEEELNTLRDGERTRASAANLEKKQWDDTRLDLESQLEEAQNLNDALKQELDRIRVERENEANSARSGGNDTELQRENDDLRRALREQEDVTEEVRREAQEFLREMRMLSQQSGSAWDRQAQLEKTIEQLDEEVREWKNRYARTKTQLRNMRATSMGLTMDQDAAKYLRERGFTTESGVVKDVHVTKFQISIDELLRRARLDDPEKVMEPMKAVIVSVRRIIKDVDESAPSDETLRQQQSKLRSRVSSTANNLITAAKNFAASAGISPVSLLDAASSHLVAAIVELLRTVKIRATPAGELEDDDDETMTPVDSTGFFSPRSNNQTPATTVSPQDTLPPPPPFQGLGGNRGSADSSAYSPISSPRESVDRFGPSAMGRGMNNISNTGLGIGSNGNGNGYSYGNANSSGAGYMMNTNKNLPPAPGGYGANGYGPAQPREDRTEELKTYIDDQTALLVNTIPELADAIRNDSPYGTIRRKIDEVADIVADIVARTKESGNGQLVGRLQTCRDRLVEAGEFGRSLSDKGTKQESREWRMWAQTLPPIAYEIARASKELVQQVDRLVISPNGGGGADEFS